MIFHPRQASTNSVTQPEKIRGREPSRRNSIQDKLKRATSDAREKLGALRRSSSRNFSRIFPSRRSSTHDQGDLSLNPIHTHRFSGASTDSASSDASHSSSDSDNNRTPPSSYGSGPRRTRQSESACPTRLKPAHTFSHRPSLSIISSEDAASMVARDPPGGCSDVTKPPSVSLDSDDGNGELDLLYINPHHTDASDEDASSISGWDVAVKEPKQHLPSGDIPVSGAIQHASSHGGPNGGQNNWSTNWGSGNHGFHDQGLMPDGDDNDTDGGGSDRPDGNSPDQPSGNSGSTDDEKPMCPFPGCQERPSKMNTHICRTHIQGLECPRDCNARFGYRWDVQRHLDTIHQEDEKFIGPMQLQKVSKIKHYQHLLFTSRYHWNYETKRQICRAESLEDLLQIVQLQRVRNTLLSPATWSSSRESEHRPPQLMIPESAGTPSGTPSDTFFSHEVPPDITQPFDLNFPVAPDLQQIPGAHPFLMDTESDISNSTLVLSNARVAAIFEFLRTTHQAYIEDSRSNPMEWGYYVHETLQCALTYAYTPEFQSSSTSPEMPWNSEMTHEDYARYRQMQPEEFEGSDSGYTTGPLSYAGQALAGTSNMPLSYQQDGDVDMAQF